MGSLQYSGVRFWSVEYQSRLLWRCPYRQPLRHYWCELLKLFVQVQTEAELDGGRKGMLLVVMLQRGAIVERSRGQVHDTGCNQISSVRAHSARNQPVLCWTCWLLSISFGKRAKRVILFLSSLKDVLLKRTKRSVLFFWCQKKWTNMGFKGESPFAFWLTR